VVIQLLSIRPLFEVANVMHWGFSADDEITTLFHFPALAGLELHFWSAVDANEGITVNHFHNFFSTEVKT
jgi:hypothetical protein